MTEHLILEDRVAGAQSPVPPVPAANVCVATSMLLSLHPVSAVPTMDQTGQQIPSLVLQSPRRTPACQPVLCGCEGRVTDDSGMIVTNRPRTKTINEQFKDPADDLNILGIAKNKPLALDGVTP